MVGPPSAAQEHRESVTPTRHPRSVPRCAAEPELAARTRQAAGPAAPRRALLQGCVCMGRGGGGGGEEGEGGWVGLGWVGWGWVG